jgi:ferrous iron transport protein A
MHARPEDGSSKKRVALTEMQAGQTGTVVEVAGGCGLSGRLDAMGIRPGRKITKISGMVLRGAVTLQVDSTKLGVGFGMASRILVEVDVPS